MDRGEASGQVVLVVDDDPDLLFAISEVLEDFGYTVVHAANGAVALQLIAGIYVSLILTDLAMPHMSGLALLEANAMRVEGGDIPIIVMTGSQNITAPPAGCLAMMHKPFSLDALLMLVKQHARPLPP